MRTFRNSSTAIACALMLGGGASIAAELPTSSVAPADGTVALVLSLHRHAIYETSDRKECPDGLNVSQGEQYLAQFPTELARAAQEVQFGYLYGNRGPHGENVLAAPLAVEDPIPFRPSQSVVAPGIDLDDRVDPEDYDSPDGRKGIDNQFNRILGCVEAFRQGGLSYYTVNRNLHLLSQRMIFVISDVDDVRNDSHVTVRTYRGFDPINYSTDDKATPGGTQRLDRQRGARFESVTGGKIVDGVLITDPVDLNMPWRPNTGANDYKLRGGRLRVALTPKDGGYVAEGYLGGFADIETWWAGFMKAYGGRMQDVSNLSAPSVYRALLKYADGYPDKAGHNTAVSIEYEVQFVSVHIVPGPDAMPARVVTPVRAGQPLSAAPLPPEIRIGATDTSGWIYTDRKGFTLYISEGDFPMKSSCTDERFVRATVNTSDAKYYLPDASKRPTCVQFSPPLLVGANTKPVGDWAMFERPDGAKQWAWKGHPVYRSSLDQDPGEVNGGGFFNYLLGGAVRTTRIPIRANLLGVPPGVTTEETPAGTILMAGENKPLFVRDGASLAKTAAGCDLDCRTGWRPFLAATLASPAGDWSVMTVGRGMRQWAYRGQALFTYDRVVLDPQVPLDTTRGWAPAVVATLPEPPKGVTVQMTIEGPAYADAAGHTLYTFHCIDETPDQVECDVKGTTQKVRLSLCGGPELCRQRFRPLYAHKGDRAPNHTWTVVKIDPETLGRMYDESQKGLYAWAYRGRPVYTFYLDKAPGDAYAHEIQIHLAADWRLIQVGTR